MPVPVPVSSNDLLARLGKERFTMDWNRAILIGAQCIVVVVLGVCVALGHNSSVTDGLLAVSGSMVGVGMYQAIKKPPTQL